ncbi:MAG: GTP-binding protein [Gemmatimonadetes bacterium]|nr:GTP-binding protein [Gemmatimonadota bacterium]MYB70906.1 GTP-binding protein [Gemmatimonadota bacterium]
MPLTPRIWSGSARRGLRRPDCRLRTTHLGELDEYASKSIRNDPHRLPRLWQDEPRRNQLVFIGRNLDEQGMRQGFEACLI